MPNGEGLYNLGGGQITPISQQEMVLPIGEATRRRQEMTGRVLPGEIDWGKKSGGFNVLELLKGIIGIPLGLLGGLFGGGEGRFGLGRGKTSPGERLAARQRPVGKSAIDYYGRYQRGLPQYQAPGQGLYQAPYSGAAASGGSGSPRVTGGGSGMPAWSGGS